MLTPELTQAISFYIFAAMVLAGGILTITRRNAVHSAIFLIGTLMGVAGLYLHLNAGVPGRRAGDLYVGGIMVLFLFVIMLVNHRSGSQGSDFQRAMDHRRGLPWCCWGLELFWFVPKAPDFPFKIARRHPAHSLRGSEIPCSNWRRVVQRLFAAV
jgi:hypothetical protein